MNFLIALFLVMGFIYVAEHSLKSSPMFYYTIASIISGIEIVAKLFELPDAVGDIFYPMFANGIISMAMFTIVMYCGVLNEKSKIKRVITPLRGTLSIIASILALGHNFSVGITSLDSLKTWAGLTSKVSLFIIVFSFINIFIMIVLLLTSVKVIKSKLTQKAWLKIQKLSYVLYALIFLQIFLVSIPLAFEGDNYYIINSIIYSVTFLVYVTLRLLKAYKITNKTRFIYLIGLAYLIVGLITLLSYINAMPKIPIDNSTEDTNNTNSFNQTYNDVEIEEETLEEEILEEETLEDEILEEETLEEETLEEETLEEETLEEETLEEEILEDESIDLLSGIFSKYENGTYTGYGQGEAALITISITIEDGLLTDIVILNHEDSPSRINRMPYLIHSIIESQSLEVDVVSGATFSSNGIIAGVEDALTTAPIVR